MTIGHVILISAGVWVVLSIAAFYAFLGLNKLAKRSVRRDREAARHARQMDAAADAGSNGE